MFCFSLYNPRGFQNKALSVIRYFLLEQIVLTNHRNPLHTLSSATTKYLHKLFATVRPRKLSLKSNKVYEPTHFRLGLQPRLLSAVGLLSAHAFPSYEWSRTPATSALLQMHIYRFLASQGCVQCCQMPAASLSLSLCCSYTKEAAICSMSARRWGHLEALFPADILASGHFMPVGTPRNKNFGKSF